jgi:hypothetical protein
MFAHLLSLCKNHKELIVFSVFPWNALTLIVNKKLCE